MKNNFSQIAHVQVLESFMSKVESRIQVLDRSSEKLNRSKGLESIDQKGLKSIAQKA